jgi:aerobic-type carbon monoxide dehydrogenase small subunit (CoxS/CutS family)
MSAINLKVNGASHTLDLDPATPLLYALSDDLALRGPKFGCGLGQCGLARYRKRTGGPLVCDPCEVSRRI